MYEMSPFGMYFLGRISEEPKYTSDVKFDQGLKRKYAGEGPYRMPNDFPLKK